MKLVKQPESLFKGERVIAVDPPFATYVSERWSRRINYYTGRTLTHTALNIEQHNHSSHLSLYGGQLSAGVVQGLQLSLEDETADIEAQRYLIQPGRGVSRNGEDINLSQPMLINVQQLPVVGQAVTDTAPPRGVGIVVLQAIVANSAGEFDAADPCEIDPHNDAFEDWQIVDGLRAVWYPWPDGWAMPLPYTSPRLRNRLAYIIYRQEQQARGMPLPWEQLGVPLALVNIAANGKVSFIDRYAVVRQGGVPNPRQSLIDTAGNDFLWQARLSGLSAHLQELRDQGLELKQALTYFQYIPPVGVLPPDIIDFTDHQTNLFPGHYSVDAVPVPLEQFELVIAAAASAQPFDLFVPERLQVLVPVPQKFFEPRLLMQETVAEVFATTINELLLELGGELGRRQALRNMAASVAGAIDRDSIPDYPEVDPQAVPGEVSNDNYSLDKKYNDIAREEVAALYDWLTENSPLTSDETNKINPKVLGSEDFIGLKPLIDELQLKIDTSNHKIDFGFLRVQTDIYRIRQMMLGNVEATRLATSPVLANIAQGLSSNATQQNLADYFASISKSGEYTSVQTADIDTAGAAPVHEAAASAAADNESEKIAMLRVNTAEMAFAKPAGIKDSGRTKKYYDVKGLIGTSNEEPLYAFADQPKNFLYRPQVYQPSAEDVEFQSPIVGESLEFRSTTVAERIAEPPAPEARSYAVASKAAVYSDLTELPINIEGIEVPMSGSESAVMTLEDYNAWFKMLSAGDAEIAVLTPRTKMTNGDVVISLVPFSNNERALLGDTEAHLRRNLNLLVGANKRSLNTPGLSGLILSGFYDPHPQDGDEGAFLSVGISALESTVSTLRKVELRINGYKQAVSRCRKALLKLQRLAGNWQLEINDSQDKLREHRHDVTIARALLQEETIRVNGINLRRKEILNNQVSFIGYMRPRTVSLRKDMPAIQLHGEFTDPLPACLQQDVAGPNELQDMMKLFRDIPLKWLPHTKNILFKLDTYPLIKSVFAFARQKAVIQMQSSSSFSPGVTAAAAQTSSKYGQAVYNLMSAQQRSKRTFIENKAVLNLQLLDNLSWQEVSVKAQDELSLQDLIESGKGKSGIAQSAARELENIQDVAVCLYARCADVAPAQRLLWADLLSEFDEPFSLKSLESLPQWDQLDFDLRRDLQRLNQWLFSRIDANIPDAVNLMNDLVRICILLASHAPVSTIINGRLKESVTGKVGDFIKLIIDKGMVRIGMQVGIFNDQSMAVQGVVEDLSDDEATVKVTQARDAAYQLKTGAVAQFYQSSNMVEQVYKGWLS